eukprot:TRINITY_DN27834_c0_g1_i1.p1 TRINITY_DN27834_c0_g1~~TRINITY_DN27834_c0_g1_i1.p1  ORF type:complete len:159 (+),score=45.78 TRINITY_DN27834_c0_g1_i1:29-505(+)
MAAFAPHDSTWSCAALCLVRSDLASMAAVARPLLKACAAAVLDAACRQGNLADESVRRQLDSEDQSLGSLQEENSAAKALQNLRRTDALVLGLPLVPEGTAQEALGLLRSKAVSDQLSSSLEELRKLRQRAELAQQWGAYMEAYGNNGLYRGFERICT